jgi:hypothetical protein
MAMGRNMSKMSMRRPMQSNGRTLRNLGDRAMKARRMRNMTRPSRPMGNRARMMRSQGGMM